MSSHIAGVLRGREADGIGGPQHEPSRAAVTSASRRVAPATAAVLFYCVIAIAAYWPVAPLSSTRIMVCGCHDPAQETWFLEWSLFALTHGHNLFFSNWIAYPNGVNLAANTSMPLLGVLGAPVTALAGPVASYNFLLRLGFAASASSAFFVFKRLRVWTPAAFLGGLLYGFSPYMVGEGLGHLFLVFVVIPPLIFLALAELLVFRRHTAWLSGAALGVLVALQYFISVEVLMTTALMAAVAIGIAIAAHPRVALERIRSALGALGCATGVALALTGYPTWYYLRGAQHIVGPSHSVASLAPYHADLLSAVVPSQSERIAPFGLWAVGNRLTGYNVTETGAYVGIPLLALALVLVVRYRHEVRIRYAAAMFVVAYVLSLGATLDVDGFNTHVPLPFVVLTRIPIIQGASAGRFSLYSNLFLAVIVAFGLDSARHDFRGRMPGRVGLLAVTAACLVPLIPSFPYHEVPTEVPAFFTSPAVARIPAGSVLLAYPYPYTPDDQAMLWGAVAGMRFRIIGGQAATPGRDGRTTSAPATLQPPTTEALFLYAMYGTPRIEGSVPPPDRSTLSSLIDFLTRYQVDTIVMDPIGEHPGLAVARLAAALGVPPEKVGGVDVWLGVQQLTARAARGR